MLFVFFATAGASGTGLGLTLASSGGARFAKGLCWGVVAPHKVSLGTIFHHLSEFPWLAVYLTRQGGLHL